MVGVILTVPDLKGKPVKTSLHYLQTTARFQARSLGKRENLAPRSLTSERIEQINSEERKVRVGPRRYKFIIKVTEERKVRIGPRRYKFITKVTAPWIKQVGAEKLRKLIHLNNRKG